VLAVHVLVAPVAYVLRILCGIRFIVCVHADEIYRPRRLVRWVLGRADRVVGVTEHSKQLAVRAGATAERIEIVPNGANLPERAQEPARVSDTSPGSRVVLTVSRLAQLYKGHDTMIRSLPLVAAQVPAVEYVVIGDGPWLGYLRDLSESLGVKTRVRFLGRVTDELRDEWFARCDVFVMLSREHPLEGAGEGMGIAFLEASARGKPIVAARSGGAVDAVRDGVSGVLVAPGSVLEAAEAVIHLLENPSEAVRLGEEGRRRIEECFTWAKATERMERVLDRVLQEPRA
jgi:phosphatidylinositol alpha-1,6-mannosyltransferase